MSKISQHVYQDNLTQFDRNFFTGKEKFTYIGSGSIGGKAHGLAYMKEVMENKIFPRYTPEISVNIPTLTVIATDYFDLFMRQNNLYELALSDTRDDLIAHAFQKAELPAQLVGDLRALIAQVHTPLAIRSSSMLEDAMFEPFASVYVTKMIPNNQPDTDSRFRKLTEAVKYIYASTFFKDAKNYIKMTKHTTTDEKMAVIIQEVVGDRFGDRYYPIISGVTRSYNFYPSGHATPEQGVVDLALGLGKAIVDDGMGWSYSPAYPKANPPFKSTGDLLKQTQTEFWAINMGKPPEYNPIKETEYINRYNLKDAEYDGTLNHLVSTYNNQNDRISIGLTGNGPRILDFAPILKTERMPLNELIKDILKTCEDVLGGMVEIEFAVKLDKKDCLPARFGFLQVRPMVVSDAKVDVAEQDLSGDNVLLASETVLGNGRLDNIKDIVYIKPDGFNAGHTPAIARQLEEVNARLVDLKKHYVLIGFGRWGTTDPQGGIPVNFGQIAGAKTIIETTLPDMNFSLSQGSHFFHNVTSFKIFYFSLYHWGKYKIKWDWLNKQTTVSETEYIRHVELLKPLQIKVDGKNGRGVIYHE